MKRIICILSPVILALSTALAAEQPAVRVTVRSFDDLGKAINRVASAVNPNAQKDFAQVFSARLGFTNPVPFDTKRPWEIALWYEGAGSSPLLAIKGPITKVSAFKASLSLEGLLSKQGKEWNQLEHGLAAIILRPEDTFSESEAAALTKWKAEPIQPPKATFELSAWLSEPTRTQAKTMLGMGRAMLGQTVTSNPAFAATGANPTAMADMFNAYFDVLDTVVDGLQKLTLGLEVTPDAIICDKRVTAKAGTELAHWMQPPADHITAADVTGLDPEALAAVAAYVGKDDSLVKLLQRFTVLGLQMQNGATNDLVCKDIAGMLAKMLPMKFSGSVNLKDMLTFSGAYTFPAGNAAEAYAVMKGFFNGSMKSMVGEGKVYSAATLAEKHHTLNGVSVDRFSMTMNLDNPMFKMPGQKAQLEALWPNGKIELDYALKDGKLLVASASGNQMRDLLDGKFSHKGSIELEKTTCLAGYFNLLDAIKQLMQANPMMPDKVKERLAKLEPQKTAIEFQVSLDNQLHCTTRVPMKLFRELGRLKDNQ